MSGGSEGRGGAAGDVVSAPAEMALGESCVSSAGKQIYGVSWPQTRPRNPLHGLLLRGPLVKQLLSSWPPSLTVRLPSGVRSALLFLPLGEAEPPAVLGPARHLGSPPRHRHVPDWADWWGLECSGKWEFPAWKCHGKHRGNHAVRERLPHRALIRTSPNNAVPAAL